MFRHTFSISAAVQASPATVHELLADYRTPRPRLLSPGSAGYEVVQGGFGAGTIFRYTMPASGPAREVRVLVEEPEARQMLTETDLQGGEVRTYTIVPAGVTGGTLLTVELSWQRSGPLAWWDRLFRVPRLRRRYAVEVSRLADFIEVYAGELSAV
jgi:hypothetical protein